MPMTVVYALEEAPRTFSKSIFLAGPSPREPWHYNWRPEAIAALERLGFDGVVFVPLPRNGEWTKNYDAQVTWELAHLNMADIVAFWVPRSKDLPALTTNVEYGLYLDSGKCVLGFPPGTPHMGYLVHHAKAEHIPVCQTLDETLQISVDRIGAGAARTGGERMVPFHVWILPQFQTWLTSQKAAGNRLDHAKLLWSFRVGSQRHLTFAYALFVDVYIASEGRHKRNEFIIARPDIATVVAYRKREPLMETAVVLIREFRSPARTSDGFIREVPGGSSWKPGEDPFVTAAHELSEETGLTIEPHRLRKIGARQLCGTLSTHQAHVFACELTDEELAFLRAQETSGVAHGVIEDTERTYVEVHRLGDLCNPSSNAVDWSMIGMIRTALD